MITKIQADEIKKRAKECSYRVLRCLISNGMNGHHPSCDCSTFRDALDAALAAVTEPEPESSAKAETCSDCGTIDDCDRHAAKPCSDCGSTGWHRCGGVYGPPV